MTEHDIARHHDVRVYLRQYDQRPPEVAWRDVYDRHTLTLDADHAEALGRALLEGARLLREGSAGKKGKRNL